MPPPFASAAEARRASIAERLESPEAPPESAVELALKHGEQETQQTRAWLTADTLRSSADDETKRKLDELTAEADAAFADFSSDVHAIKNAPSSPAEKPPAQPSGPDTSDVDSGWESMPASETLPTPKGSGPDTSDVDTEWETPPESQERPITKKQEATEANTETMADWEQENAVRAGLQNLLGGGTVDAAFATLAATERGRDVIRLEFENTLPGLLSKNRVDFTSFERLLDAAQNQPIVKTELAEQLSKTVGKKYSERLLADPTFRSELNDLQERLKGAPSENGPALCDESSIEQLICIQETLGESIFEAARAMNLAEYTDELAIDTTKRKSIISIYDVSFDAQDGECAGKINMRYNYGTEKESPAIERSFIRTRQGGAGTEPTMERIAVLDYIRLPNSLKKGGIAQREIEMSESNLANAGFEAVALHANIDLGGYVWATKGYLWDPEAMRRPGEEEKDDAEVIRDFIQGALDRLMDKLQFSKINSSDPAIAEALGEIQRCLESPLAVTPQHLAEIGLQGPKFIQTEHGFIREEAYDEQARITSPPLAGIKGAQHLGKMLLIHSDWYGKKPLQKKEVTA